MPMRYMGNFKAVAIDYEYYLSLSDVPQSVCLTEQQMYVLMVQNTYTFWATRWYNIEDTSAAQLQLIAAEIEDLLMCGCGVPEPSITDRYNTTTYATTTYASYQETYNTWNDAGQTVGSIAPNLDYDTGSPPDIDKVLCLNISLLLRTIVDTATKTKQQSDQESRDLVTQLRNVFAALAVAGGAALASGGLLAAAAAFFMGPELVFGLAIVSVGLALIGLLAETDLTVFQDPIAYGLVQCTLVQNLVGEQLTRARFMSGLTPNDFIAGSNAEKLAAIVNPYLQDLNVYLQFLSTGNGVYDAANIGDLPDCEVCPSDCHDFGLNTATWNSGDGAATGITLTNGVDYHVDIAGTYTYGAGPSSVNADGHTSDFTPGTIDTSVNDLRALGKIGISGSWFALGVSTDFTASASGELYMIVNDVNAAINFADNVGTLTATVCPA